MFLLNDYTADNYTDAKYYNPRLYLPSFFFFVENTHLRTPFWVKERCVSTLNPPYVLLNNPDGERCAAVCQQHNSTVPFRVNSQHSFRFICALTCIFIFVYYYLIIFMMLLCVDFIGGFSALCLLIIRLCMFFSLVLFDPNFLLKTLWLEFLASEIF